MKGVTAVVRLHAEFYPPSRKMSRVDESMRAIKIKITSFII